MPSYVVTGASRGLGFEFINQLSSDASNIVIGLVRDKASTEAKVAQEIGQRANLHILKGDLEDYASLKAAAEETSKITGGAVDIIIGNGALVSDYSAYDTLTELGAKDAAGLEADLFKSFRINVVGNIHLYNLFLPLIQRGSIKKVVALSTGMADVPFIAENGIDNAAPYSISKAALNTAVAKFHAEYKDQGILFMGISPGYVATSTKSDYTPEQLEKLGRMGAKFAAYAPHMTGPIQPVDSVKAVLDVVGKATVEKNGGLMVSHLGNTRWL